MSATRTELQRRASADAAALAQSHGKHIRLSRLRKLRACEQVAAVCYRIRSGQIEFLLVRTRRGKRWTFPKGSAERGLTHAQAAALEAFEEAGVHGRIEEAPFARYRRLGRDDASGERSHEDRSIHAHLCQVLRLSAPKESGRERTWFSASEARKCLCEGRTSKQASEFVRVIGQAVELIGQLIGLRVDERPFADTPVRATRQVADRGVRGPATQGRDALQQVKFDFSEVCGWMQGASFKTDNWRTNARRDSPLPPRVRQRENLACEILECGSEGRLKLPN